MNDAARMPDRTVSVKNGQVVAIQFMRGVYSTDAEAPHTMAMNGITKMTAVGLSSNPTPTAAELRAETQARIRAAEQRGNVSE